MNGQGHKSSSQKLDLAKKKSSKVFLDFCWTAEKLSGLKMKWIGRVFKKLYYHYAGNLLQPVASAAAAAAELSIWLMWEIISFLVGKIVLEREAVNLCPQRNEKGEGR